MKRMRSEKLRLSRETLRSISQGELAKAGGGVRDSGPEGYLCGTVPSDCGWTYCGPCGLAQAPPNAQIVIAPIKRV